MLWEFCLIGFQVFCGVSFLIYCCVLLSKKKRQAKSENCPTADYIKARFNFKSWLEVKHEDGETQAEKIFLDLRLVIEGVEVANK
jgi:hypothetical protein